MDCLVPVSSISWHLRLVADADTYVWAVAPLPPLCTACSSLLAGSHAYMPDALDAASGGWVGSVYHFSVLSLLGSAIAQRVGSFSVHLVVLMWHKTNMLAGPFWLCFLFYGSKS